MIIGLTGVKELLTIICWYLFNQQVIAHLSEECKSGVGVEIFSE
jgi:hypothetical protein